MSSSFGRRSVHQPPKAPLPAVSKFARPGVATKSAKPIQPSPSSVDEELRHWKSTRRTAFPIRTLALIASLSFGIASFALPKEINDEVQWPLYALSAASLYVGFRRKRQKR